MTSPTTSMKFTMVRKLLQYIKIFNIIVNVNNILGYYDSLPADIVFSQLPETK
jgi:hypothetical protein